MIGPFSHELHVAMADEFSMHVSRVASCLQASFDECLARVGISMEDFEVLRALSGDRGGTITQIMNDLGFDRVKVIVILGRLREASLVKPASVAARSRTILTPRGRATIASIQFDWSNRLHHRFGALSVPRLQALCDILRRL